jgi:NAD(P) transhydrogenase subunit alpha
MSEAFIQGIVVFVLASFVGFEVIRRVPPTLHTPLMSGANAISGITIVGAILAVTLASIDGLSTLAVVAISILAFLAIVFAMINVVGGFLVTDRMLEMFKKVPGK